MDKRTYIEQEILKILQSAATFGVGYGVILIVSLSVLDYYVMPENITRFLLYRLITAVLFIIIFFLNKLKASKQYQASIFFVGAIIVSTMVELMVLSSGGHQSSYYAGMIIVFMFCLGFLPLFSVKMTFLMAAMTYSIYLLPILIFDTITNVRMFINNNAFLLATAGIGILWRFYNDKLLVEKLSLEYDLDKDKKHLEVYSLQLKAMVEERTKDLNKSEQWHKSLFENATDGIMVLDRDGVIMNVNERACQMHGFNREAMVGTYSGLLEAEDNKAKVSERMRRMILHGESLVFETEHYRKDGSRISLEVTSKAIPIGDEVFIQSFHRDITEKKRIQEHLFQSQKMESIGTLAGGIAHDFNNVLTAILGYTELIRHDSDPNEKLFSRLNVIERAARNAGGMISQLLGFARKSDFEILSLNLNDVIRDTVKLLERILDKKITVNLELDDTTPLINGDIAHIEQVIMNLMVNARDAMPTGGLITISTACVSAGEGATGIPPYIPPGRYVVLRVTDTGSGIPDKIKDRIFEPFFTTKERGKGTGLGLSMVYGVVTEHKGYITVQSRPDEGTTFTIYLPASAKSAAAAKTRPLDSVRGHETVLVVDDDEAVLGFVRESLELNGYTVIATTNPMSAIDAFKKMHSEISLVVTDVVMPLIDGGELIRQIKGIKPATKVLTISGYSKYIADSEDIKASVFLQKPFESSYLLTTVRRVLDAEMHTA